MKKERNSEAEQGINSSFRALRGDFYFRFTRIFVTQFLQNNFYAIRWILINPISIFVDVQFRRVPETENIVFFSRFTALQLRFRVFIYCGSGKQCRIMFVTCVTVAMWRVISLANYRTPKMEDVFFSALRTLFVCVSVYNKRGFLSTLLENQKK